MKQTKKILTPTAERIKKLDAEIARHCKQLGIKIPKTRGDCVDGPRPCPWVRCRHHVVEVRFVHGRTVDSFRVSHDGDLDQLSDTCTLDLAERGVCRLSDVANAMGVTRERIRQQEIIAMGRLLANGSALEEIGKSLLSDAEVRRTQLAAQEAARMFRGGLADLHKRTRKLGPEARAWVDRMQETRERLAFVDPFVNGQGEESDDAS